MDLGKNIQQSIDVYLKNFGTLFVAGLVASILTCVTLGILGGPLLGGYLILIKKLNRGETAEFNEIFNHFDKLVPTLLLGLILAGIGIAYFILNTILAFIPFLGWLIMFLLGIALFAASPALAMIYTLAVGLIVEKNMDISTAVKTALSHFMKDPVMNWLYSLVMVILSSVLWFVSQPIFTIGMAFSSEEITLDGTTPLNPDVSA